MSIRPHSKSTLSRLLKLSLAVFSVCLLCIVSQLTGAARAEEAPAVLGSLDSVVQGDASNTVLLTYHSGAKGKLVFLDTGIFRFTVDPKGVFNEYATPRQPSHVARIQQQPDSSDVYAHPAATVKDAGASWQIASGKTLITFDKTTGKMSASVDGTQVFAEAAPLSLKSNETVQSLVENPGENFYGGGTQNGRFTHRGQSIQIVNTNSWTDGGVASPNPFYWSSKGYGVLRNTFAEGRYDFGESKDGVVKATHSDGNFDAYFFVAKPASASQTAQSLLGDYFKVTGSPVLLPEFSFYLGHLNAYNRDGWSDQPSAGAQGWTIKGSEPSTSAGTTEYESGRQAGYVVPSNLQAESLNGHGPTVATQNMHPAGYARKYSAQAVIDEYVKYDMPLGWFLPNDGYGAGYGQNGFNVTGGVNPDKSSTPERIAAVDANVANLREFTQYANAHGVQTGLWTQSNLVPDSNPNTKWQLLRDFYKEVNTGGISTLKTDVAWVGYGYSFGLNGTKTAYDVLSAAHKRPAIVSLDGWAGSQRFASIWTGDQQGGQWEYIRFHIPTYIGQGLSGNPNIGSDMDGIFGGSPLISARDFEWKTFTPIMLDMDGWGTYAKKPFVHGDPYTGISRMYLKLKARLMPYIYTTAASAANINTGNGDTGLPMIRATFLDDSSDFAASKATQYQFLFGKNFLVAPVYQNTHADATGNDVRNDIYLPGDKSTIWIDYFTGKQYRGGQVINNFDAPLWKLPLFVRSGSIVPMYTENNNPSPKSASNPKGLDKTKRVIEFWPAGSTDYTLYEDDGQSIQNAMKKDASYGVLDKISYGGSVSTKITSVVDGTTATLTANASKGSYNGYDSNRSTQFVVNVSKKPTSVTMKNGSATLSAREVTSKQDFDAAGDADSVYFYDQTPNLNTTPENENFSKTKITTTPKLYVHFAKTDVAQNAQTLVLAGFENKGELPKDALNSNLAAPTITIPQDRISDSAITVNWSTVPDATSYELWCDGTIYDMGNATSYTHTGLHFASTHQYKIRSRNADGYSAWSDVAKATTSEDPWKNVPKGQYSFTGPIWNGHKIGYAFDHSMGTLFHSNGIREGRDYAKIQYDKAYELDKLEYYPRTDAGNGTVTQARIWWSLDGTHWNHQDVNWPRSSATKTFTFPNGTAAQVVAIQPLASVGNFFSAREIAVYKKAGSEGFEVGSNTMKPAVSEADYTNMMNYLALENRDPDTSTFQAQIKGHHADLNANDIYDVYDYAFTMAKLDGGTKQSGKVSGALSIVPVKVDPAYGERSARTRRDTSAQTTLTPAENVHAGDVVTYNVYADNIKNANALGAIVHYKSSDFEYVKDSLKPTAKIAGMENLSKAKTEFSDGVQTINLAFANRGNKPLFNGSGVVAQFKLRALKDINSALPAHTILVGPGLDSAETDLSAQPTPPAAPKPQAKEYPQSAFDITMTNDLLTTDDGGNVHKLIQQDGYEGLFDGTETYGNGIFEFKWDIPQNHDSTGHLPKYVKLPTTIHFAFKQPSTLDNVVVVNRASGNGTVRKIKAKIFFEDGTSQEFAGGDYDTQQGRYTFALSGANKAKKVTKVDITPLETNNPQMLTLLETNFNYTDGPAAGSVSAIKADPANKKLIYVGDVTPVNATVEPEGAYKAFKAESSDPSIASVSYSQEAGQNKPIKVFVAGKKPGKVTITLTSLADPTKTATYELEVKEGVDTAELEKAIQKASKLSPEVYTPESYAAVEKAKKEAEDLLKSPNYTKDQVDLATAKLNQALNSLEVRPLDPKKVINTKANTGDGTDPITVAYASTEITEAEGENGVAANLLDYNNNTYWHTDYLKENTFPASLIFKVNGDYKVSDIAFLPRQDGGTNGDIFATEVYASDDLEALKSDKPSDKVQKLGEYTFTHGNSTLEARDQLKQMAFAPTMARYFKIKVVHAGGQSLDSYASASEIRFYGDKIVTVNKDVLSKLVTDQKALKLKGDDYTEETWTPYANALSDAERILADEKASQDEVDGAVKALEDAYKTLAKKPANPTPPEVKPAPTPGEPAKPGKPGEPVKPSKPAKPAPKPEPGKKPAKKIAVPRTADPTGIATFVTLTLGGLGLSITGRRMRK